MLEVYVSSALRLCTTQLSPWVLGLNQDSSSKVLLEAMRTWKVLMQTNKLL